MELVYLVVTAIVFLPAFTVWMFVAPKTQVYPFKLTEEQRLGITAAFGILVPFLSILLGGIWWGTVWNCLFAGAVWFIAVTIDSSTFFARRRIKLELEDIHQELKTKELDMPPFEEFAERLMQTYKRRCIASGEWLIKPIRDAYLDTLHERYRVIFKRTPVKPPDVSGKDLFYLTAHDDPDVAAYTGFAYSRMKRFENVVQTEQAMQSACLEALLLGLSRRAPQSCFTPIDDEEAPAEALFQVPLGELMPDETIDIRIGVMRSLLHSSELMNLWINSDEFEKWDGRKLFATKVPLSITEKRFLHQWVLGTTGSGKSQLLQTQIIQDLAAVARGEASIIVMDSQGMEPDKLLGKLSHLKMFAKGEPLEGKLVLLEPDPDWPLALNLFDMGQQDPTLPKRERHIRLAAAKKLISYSLSGSSDLQEDMLEFMIDLALATPNPNLRTLQDILTDKKLARFGEYLRDVDEAVRDYFLHVFPQSTVQPTKDALLRRLSGMTRHPVFREMFRSKENRFRMLDQIDAGKVIVIHTDKALLEDDACGVFGRFFIAQLLQATRQRTGDKKPVYCYIDECHDYIAHDENIEQLFDQARKQNVGMILAHQRLSNIKAAGVLDALSSAGIKCVGSVDTAIEHVAKLVRAESPDVIANLPTLTFATYIRDQTPHAIPMTVPYGVMENLPKMTAAEFEAVKDEMHDKFCAPKTQPVPSASQDSKSSLSIVPIEPNDEPDGWERVV